MNKNAIQRFAIWARTELISQVSQRAYQYDITADGYGDYNSEVVAGRLLSEDEKKQRQQLINQIRSKGYAQVMEEVAYTWFNRFIALRFMEINNYLPTHIRVFSDASGAFKPEILSNALHLDLQGLDMEKVSNLIEKNQTEDLYRYLLLTQCNALSVSLSRMFEKMGSYTELLLPNNILRQDGILGRMVTDIPEEDWTDQVQIIGWIYQYYISEKHDQIINIYKGTVKKADIPAATQLFTTDWVVRYMVDNSLGRYWIERHPESRLKEKLSFLAVPKNKEIPAIHDHISPQDITFFDPCMGSGHILVYAFDVLMEIYKECGYGERDAAVEIVKNNLFGLDIDERCSQLAYFAIMMKARSYDRRFLTRGIVPNVLPIYESNAIAKFTHSSFMPDQKMNEVGEYLISSFRHAKEIGSLLAIKLEDYDAFLSYISNCAENASIDLGFSYWNSQERPIIEQLVNQAKIMTRKYTVVSTNPPYLGKFESHLKDFVVSEYKPYSSDLFSVFMYRNFNYCIAGGYTSFMTPFVWMFIKAYENLRKYIIEQKHISTLVQMEYSAFEEATVPICTFVLKNERCNNPFLCFRLSDFKGGMEIQKEKVLDAIKDPSCGYYYEARQEDFARIPGSPIAYWVSKQFINAFSNEPISKYAISDGQTKTGNNSLYLRNLWEVENTRIGKGKKWALIAKGGNFRRWAGNIDTVIDWSESARNHYRADHVARIAPEYIWFRKGVCWNHVTSGSLFAARYISDDMLFETAAPAIFFDNEELLYYVIGYLNSSFSGLALRFINPTISTNVGDITCQPLIRDNTKFDYIVSKVKETILLSQSDWNDFETAWDFEIHPIVKKALSCFHRGYDGAIGIEYVYKYVALDFEERFQKLKANEEELNRIFIDIYGLQDELTPEVEDKDVTVRRAELGRDIRSMISYAVGCMFGRYSLSQWGLAYAGGEWNSGGRVCVDYGEFEPDKDNIIPICDDEYFDDDITGLFINWVEVVFGKETLEENLKFIADALGGKGTPREVIRNYFLNGFYADHLKTYQKRPIYWLFDSGKKNGFKALIYMHRYQSDLLARMRTDYVHEQQERYRTQLGHIGDAMNSAPASERVKLAKQQKKLQEQALELQKYEEKVHHLADQNIKIDLDDGVKHNYALFTDVLAKIK